MLEILFVIHLCKKNAAAAAQRGRKPGGFVALTVLLWVGMEFLGGFIGGLTDMGAGTYLLALAMAAAGGVISSVIAKNCRIAAKAVPAAEEGRRPPAPGPVPEKHS